MDLQTYYIDTEQPFYSKELFKKLHFWECGAEKY